MMTRFSQQLGAFFAGSISFAELEQSAESIGGDEDNVAHAVGLIDMHRDAGRLTPALHRLLQDRLNGVERSGNESDITDLLSDGGPLSEAPEDKTAVLTGGARTSDVDNEDQLSDATERSWTGAWQAAKSGIDDDRDKTARSVETTQPLAAREAEPQVEVPLDDRSTDVTSRLDTSDDLTAQMPASDEAAERYISPKEVTARLKQLADVPAESDALEDVTAQIPATDEATEHYVRPTDAGAEAEADDATAFLGTDEKAFADGEATAQYGSREDLTARLTSDADDGVDTDETAQLPRGEDLTDIQAPPTPVHEPTVKLTPAIEPTEKIPPLNARTQRIDRNADSTLKINSHVAPTERINRHVQPTEKIHKNNQPTERINRHVAPTERLGEPVEVTEKLADGDRLFSDDTQLTEPLPGGTGSNWLRPDQWTASPTGPLGPGSVLKRRFLIESQLGRGGMGVVFKARDKRKEEAQDRDPYVAIKVLNDDFRDHPQALIALQREARKAQTLAHPNVITVYDFDRDGTTVYMTMELMRGEPLDALLRRHKKDGIELDVDVARSIIEEMAAGLAYAHERDIIHSDFKPGNVFLTKDNRVKILDFGIARASVYSGNKQTEQTLFDAGDLGSLTPGYASYEMFHAADPHPADDVYALAITAYLLLTGEHPFQRVTAEEALEKNLVPQPIKTISRREWQAIAHGLQLRREDRTEGAAQFLREFRGPVKVARWATAVIGALACVALYFAYASFQAPGPAIEWSELSTQQQTAFRQKIDSANEWLANDPPWIGGAYADFADAYTIHPRNPQATKGLNSVAASFIALAEAATTEDEKRRVLEDMETVSANEYLAEHRKLRKMRERLSTELSESR